MAYGAIKRTRSKSRAAQRRLWGNLDRRGKLPFAVKRNAGGTYRAAVCTSQTDLIHYAPALARAAMTPGSGIAGRRFKRCGLGHGKNPTSALKRALKNLAGRLK